LARHGTIATVHLATIVVKYVLVVVVVRLGNRLGGISRLPTGGTKRDVVLQLVVGDGVGFRVTCALVIKRVGGRRALHQRATGTTVSLIALAAPVFVGIPSAVVGSEIGLFEFVVDVG